MAFHKNAEYTFVAGFLTLTILTLPLVLTENIDCKGKAFHCVNSTHFKICVDFGGGVSKTVDEFLIPCPTNTVCRDLNKFECENQETTTLAPIRQSDVTNGQLELSVTSAWDKTYATILFPEYNINKSEELRKYYNSSVNTTELSSSVISNDTTDLTLSTTLDGILNQVNLSSENNTPYNKRSNLSDSDAVSPASTSSFDIVTNNSVFSTTSAKATVNDITLNVALHKSTTKSRNDVASEKTNEIFEGVTKRNIGLVESINRTDLNIRNNNEYRNTNKTVTLSGFVSQTNSLYPTSENLKNAIPFSVETVSATNDPNVPTTTVIVYGNSNIANDHKSINLLNSVNTSDSYSTDREQTIKTNGDTISTSTNDYKLLPTETIEPFHNEAFNLTEGSIISLMDNLTTLAYTEIHTTTEKTVSKFLTNIFNINFHPTNIMHDKISNSTKTLFTSYSFNEFSSTMSPKQIFGNTNENFTVENRTLDNKDDYLITSTTNSNYRKSVEKNITSTTDTTTLYLINRYQTNDSLDMSPILDNVNLAESNPTTPYVAILSEVLLDSTITVNKSNDLLRPTTFSDHPTTDLSDLNITSIVLTNLTSTDLETSTGLVINKGNNASKFKDIFPISTLINVSLENSYPINVTKENLYVEVTMDEKLVVNNTSTENSNFADKDTTLVTANMSMPNSLFVELTQYNITITTELNPVATLDEVAPYANLFPLNNVSGLHSSTTLQFTSLPERYQSITTVNPEAYQSNLSTSQSFPYVKEKTAYYLENINKTFEIITSTEEPASLTSITNKHFGNLNSHSSPVTTLPESISIHPFTIQAKNNSNNTYLNKAKLHVPYITNNYSLPYAINEQLQPPKNESVTENILYNTQRNDEHLFLNKVITSEKNTLSNVEILGSEIKTKTKTVEILNMTEPTTAAVNYNLPLPDHGESINTYHVTQNIVEKTKPFIYQKQNATKVFSLRYMNNQTQSDPQDVANSNSENSLHFKPLYDLNNMSKLEGNVSNKEAVLKPGALNYSSYSPVKIHSWLFENNLGVKTPDLTSNSEKKSQTTSRTTVSEKNSASTLSTNSNYLIENNKRIATTVNILNIMLKNASNIPKITGTTRDETLTRHTTNIKSSLADTGVTNNPKNFLVFENTSTTSFGLSQNLKSSINDIPLKYNSTFLLKQSITDSNKSLNQFLESNTDRNVSSNNINSFFNKSSLPDSSYYNNNIEHQPIATSTEESVSTDLIPNKLKTPLTAQFTCLNRDRGKYSDKNNCNKFYICVGKLEAIIGMCPVDTVFSEINKQCTKNLSHCIRNKQFRCLSSGRFIDILSEKDYYICVKNLDGYVRFKLQCQKGYHLNKEHIQCSSETSIENISKTISDKSTNEKKSKEIGQSENFETQFDCEKEGKFEHPDDCRKYFVCTKSSKSEFRRKIKKCDSDEVFNKNKRKCVDSGSYEC